MHWMTYVNNSLHAKGQNGAIFLHFSSTLTHLFTACKWPKYYNIFLQFSCTVIQHEMAKMVEFSAFSSTLTHLLTTCKWAKYYNIFLQFSCTVIQHEMIKMVQLFCFFHAVCNFISWPKMVNGSQTLSHEFKFVKEATTSLLDSGWRLQSRETCHDFTICFSNIML